MPKNTYDIVDWFIQKLNFNFNDYVDDETKDKIEDQSSQEFFRKGMDIAISKAESSEKANTLRKLKRNTNMESNAVGGIIGNSKFSSNLDDFFETKLKEMVDETELPDEWKNELITDIPKYDDKKSLRKIIKTKVNEWEIQEAEREERKMEISERRRLFKEARERGIELEVSDVRRLQELPTEQIERELEEAFKEQEIEKMLKQQAKKRAIRLAKLKEIEETGGGVSPDF